MIVRRVRKRHVCGNICSLLMANAVDVDMRTADVIQERSCNSGWQKEKERGVRGEREVRKWKERLEFQCYFLAFVGLLVPRVVHLDCMLSDAWCINLMQNKVWGGSQEHRDIGTSGRRRFPLKTGEESRQNWNFDSLYARWLQANVDAPIYVPRYSGCFTLECNSSKCGYPGMCSAPPPTV